MSATTPAVVGADYLVVCVETPLECCVNKNIHTETVDKLLCYMGQAKSRT